MPSVDNNRRQKRATIINRQHQRRLKLHHRHHQSLQSGVTQNQHQYPALSQMEVWTHQHPSGVRLQSHQWMIWCIRTVACKEPEHTQWATCIADILIKITDHLHTTETPTTWHQCSFQSCIPTRLTPCPTHTQTSILHYQRHKAFPDHQLQVETVWNTKTRHHGLSFKCCNSDIIVVMQQSLWLFITAGEWISIRRRSVHSVYMVRADSGNKSNFRWNCRLQNYGGQGARGERHLRCKLTDTSENLQDIPKCLRGCEDWVEDLHYDNQFVDVVKPYRCCIEYNQEMEVILTSILNLYIPSFFLHFFFFHFIP